MITIILSLIIGSTVYQLLNRVYKEPRSISTTFAIFMFIGGSIITSYIFTPVETKILEIPITDIIQYYKNSSSRTNKDIINKLEEQLNKGNQIIYFKKTTIHYRNNTKYSFYPNSVLARLKNNSKIIPR